MISGSVLGRLFSSSISKLSMVGRMSTPSKLAKTTSYIGTHDGTFHCDDVTACYMLRRLDRFRDHDIVRSRDPETLAKAEIVVDVGSVLDVETLRLDHHQRTFNQTIHDYHPKLRVTNQGKPPRLSSSGLVYAIFGKDVIVNLLKLGQKYENLEEEQKKMIDTIYEKAYTEFFEEIDAIDNGIEIVSGDNLVYNYHFSTDISSRVARLNPREKNPTYEQRMIQFHKAMDMVGAEIVQGIDFLGTVWWPKRQEFRQFVIKREQFDPSGQIVHLEGDLVGWKSALFDLEEELGIVGQIKYVIYQDGSDCPKWRATAMPVSLKSFECRVPLKEDWRGKRDEELQAASGINDASFVHMSGFTGGAASLEGIKSMVLQTLGLHRPEDNASRNQSKAS